jgi:hypothetical protein
MYGDMSLEDVDEFEGLEPEDGREVEPEGRFQRDEVRNFEKDFEYELDEAEEYDLDRDLADDGSDSYDESGMYIDDEDLEQELQELSEDLLP